MKILLLTTLVALATADVSHLLTQGNPGYAYQAPISSYGVPQASVLGGASNAVSYSAGGSLSLPTASAGDFNGQSLSFGAGFPSNSADGLTIQSYSNLPAGVAVSSTASPLNVDFSGGFVSSTPASIPSVNFVQYAQQQQPAVGNVQYSVGSSAAPAFSASQFASDASLNSAGFGAGLSSANFGSSAGLGSAANFGSSAGFSSGVDSGAARFGGIGGSISSGFGLSGGVSGASSYSGQTSGGSLDESFGVATDAASGAAAQSDVSKHLYFFAAPEEPEEEIQAKIDLPPVPPKKSYKIIFIKAPSYRLPSTINVPAQPQNEEKTLVYVLVKKPEVHPKVRYQGAIPAKPSKPEVFFIKYKTQKEAEAAVAEIQSKHGAQGQVIANLPAGVQLAGQQAEAIAANAAAVATGGSAADFGAQGVTADFGAQHVSADFGAQGATADFGAQNAAADFGASAGADSSSSVSSGSIGAGFEARFSGGQGGQSETTSFQLNIPSVSSTISTTLVGGSSGADASGAVESSQHVEAEQHNEVSGSAGAEEHVVSIGGASAGAEAGHADEGASENSAQVQGFSTYGVPSA